MNDRLDRLERLNRLRESGALTEAEYNAEKEALLKQQGPSPEAGPPPAPQPGQRQARRGIGRPLGLGLAALAVLAVVAIAMLASRPSGQDQAAVVADAPSVQVAAVEPAAAPIPAAAPTSNTTPAELIRLWNAENEACRGGSGDDPRTLAACERREALGPRINGLGYCYGREGEAGYQERWHSCEPSSIRFTPAASVPAPGAPATIPAAFRGTWASNAGQCGEDSEDPARMIVRAREIQFYEPIGVPMSVEQPNGREVLITTRMEYADDIWTELIRFQLSADGRTLTDRSEGLSSRLVRC